MKYNGNYSKLIQNALNIDTVDDDNTKSKLTVNYVKDNVLNKPKFHFFITQIILCWIFGVSNLTFSDFNQDLKLFKNPEIGTHFRKNIEHFQVCKSWMSRRIMNSIEQNWEDVFEEIFIDIYCKLVQFFVTEFKQSQAQFEEQFEREFVFSVLRKADEITDLEMLTNTIFKTKSKTYSSEPKSKFLKKWKQNNIKRIKKGNVNRK